MCLQVQQLLLLSKNICRDYETNAVAYEIQWNCCKPFNIMDFTLSFQGAGTAQEVPSWFPWCWSSSWHLPGPSTWKVCLPERVFTRIKQRSKQYGKRSVIMHIHTWSGLSWDNQLCLNPRMPRASRAPGLLTQGSCLITLSLTPKPVPHLTSLTWGHPGSCVTGASPIWRG